MAFPDKACIYAFNGHSMDCLFNPRIEQMKCYKYGFGQSMDCPNKAWILTLSHPFVVPDVVLFTSFY